MELFPQAELALIPTPREPSSTKTLENNLNAQGSMA
jgi:hypothetical protein